MLSIWNFCSKPKNLRVLMIKSFLWFAYDILFSILICSAIGLILMEYLVDFQWYLLAFFCLIFLVSGYYIILFSKNKNRLYKSLVADLESADSRLDFNLFSIILFCYYIWHNKSRL